MGNSLGYPELKTPMWGTWFQDLAKSFCVYLISGRPKWAKYADQLYWECRGPASCGHADRRAAWTEAARAWSYQRKCFRSPDGWTLSKRKGLYLKGPCDYTPKQSKNLRGSEHTFDWLCLYSAAQYKKIFRLIKKLVFSVTGRSAAAEASPRSIFLIFGGMLRITSWASAWYKAARLCLLSSLTGFWHVWPFPGWTKPRLSRQTPGSDITQPLTTEMNNPVLEIWSAQETLITEEEEKVNASFLHGSNSMVRFERNWRSLLRKMTEASYRTGYRIA